MISGAKFVVPSVIRVIIALIGHFFITTYLIPVSHSCYVSTLGYDEIVSTV